MAIIGCGYAADFYMANLPNHPQLQLCGAFDRDADRLRRFSQYHGVRAYSSLDEVLSDPAVTLVINLTNPDSHHVVSRACLEAGRHVYSEKPMATSLAQAKELVTLARRRGVQLASAPCTLLGEAAQTAWKIVREGGIGRPLLILADLSEGMVHRLPYDRWISASGAPWPAADEFEVGCTLEHAAYLLSWLTAFFGRIEELTAHAARLVDEKIPGVMSGPDFSSGVLRMASGCLARISFSMLTPRDRRMVVVGEEGVLTVEDVWDFASPIWLRRYVRPSAAKPARYLDTPRRQPLLSGQPRPYRYEDSHNIDQMRGIAEMAQAIDAGRASRLSGERALHILEATLAIGAATPVRARSLQTPFEKVEPMPWAR